MLTYWVHTDYSAKSKKGGSATRSSFVFDGILLAPFRHYRRTEL